MRPQTQTKQVTVTHLAGVRVDELVGAWLELCCVTVHINKVKDGLHRVRAPEAPALAAAVRQTHLCRGAHTSGTTESQHSV